MIINLHKIIVELLLYVAGYIVGGLCGTFPVEAVLKRVMLSKEDLEIRQVKGAGRIIGILERIFTITCIYLNAPTAISIIFAAKSIIRFESTKERPFAEYYLIGTLTSITYGMIIGLIFNGALALIY